MEWKSRQKNRGEKWPELAIIQFNIFIHFGYFKLFDFKIFAQLESH